MFIHFLKYMIYITLYNFFSCQKGLFFLLQERNAFISEGAELSLFFKGAVIFKENLHPLG